MANPPSLQHELPRKVLDQLDPKVAKLYSRLSPDLSSRIARLVNEASSFGIHPNRLVKYAFLFAMAERQAQGNAVSEDHTTRAKHDLAGELHGLPTGSRYQAEAKRRYRVGRRARQQVQASLGAFLEKWHVFEHIVQKHRSELPIHLQSRFSDAELRKLAKTFQNMGIALVLDEEDLVSEKHRERERSEIAQTYLWWRLAMAHYRGKWNDMHLLASTWRLTPTASVMRFRKVVNRICKGAACTYPFGESWRSVLSEE